MQRRWNNATDCWEIYIENPRDPALAEYEFPQAARGWLGTPGELVRELEVVGEISESFFTRMQRLTTLARVRVACVVPERAERPSSYFAIFGSPDDPTIALSLKPGTAPDWTPFPRISPEFQITCSQLAGTRLNGVCWPPVILPCAIWPRWESVFPSGLDRKPIVSETLEKRTGERWVLQMNDMGVFTFLEAPGRIVLADWRGNVHPLNGVSPEQWLARELSGEEQPPTAT